MKTFKELALQNITEATKITGKLKTHEKLLYNTYIEFLKDYYNVKHNIVLSIRKPNNSPYVGYIDLIALKAGNYKIIVENISYGILGKIGHEFTHVAQYHRGDFDYTKDEKSLLWKGKEFITVKEYSKITDLSIHKKLPWEKEAYEMQEELPELFKNSNFLKDIIGKNATLDFGIENNLWF
jgi:hypothetical protein